MSDETVAHVVEPVEPVEENEAVAYAVEPAEEKELVTKKSPSFHLAPNKETFHLIKDPITVHPEKVPADSEDATSPSFHLRPNKETFHKIDDPLKLKK